ncbi:MAG: hypothetical protein IJ077_04335 [Eubacterium sp.]|nr:hypothetical protein [Eubacterium sp.]MBR2278341.1 hypothetical protein [Eubacterium sp.]
MKKVIAISLAVVFVLLAFAGCSKGGPKKVLTQTKWVNIIDESSTITFNSDGTADYGVNKDVKWTLNEDTIEVSYTYSSTGFYGESDTSNVKETYKLVQDDSTSLVRQDLLSAYDTYIPEENYDENRKPLLDAYAKDAVDFDREAYVQAYKANDAKADKDYGTNIQKVESVVREIEGNTVIVSKEAHDGFPVDAIKLYNITDDTVEKLTVGDKVVFYGYATSYIDGFGDVYLLGFIAEINGVSQY